MVICFWCKILVAVENPCEISEIVSRCAFGGWLLSQISYCCREAYLPRDM